MSNKTLSSQIGNIRRKYPKGETNLFRAMSFVYNRCLHKGTGSKVMVIGHSESFKENIVKAWWHVMADRKILRAGMPVPVPELGKVDTHTGANIFFKTIQDHGSSVNSFNRALSEGDYIILCDEYNSPDLREMCRFMLNTKEIYTLSEK